MSSYVALKTVWILVSWLLIWIYIVYKRVDFWFHNVFERVNCLSTERYKLICSLGQVKFSTDKNIIDGHLFVTGQVENFTIYTPGKSIQGAYR